MKKLTDYITESEFPVAGDTFAINIREECLIESHVVDVVEDGIVIEGDERLLALLEEYGFQLETIRRYGAVGSSAGQGYTMDEDGVADMPSRRGFLKGLASFAASAAVPSSVVKMLSTPAGVGTLSISAGLALLKGIQDHLDQFDAEDDDDFHDAYESMADELGYENDGEGIYATGQLTDLLDLYQENPEEAAQQLIKHIQSRAIDPADVKSTLQPRDDWRYHDRKDHDNDANTSTTPDTKLGTTAADNLFNKAVSSSSNTIKQIPAKSTTALAAPAVSPGMQIPKQKLKVPDEQDKELALIRSRAGLAETAPYQPETDANHNDPLAAKAADDAAVGPLEEDGVDPVNAQGQDAEDLQGQDTSSTIGAIDEAEYQGRKVKLGKPMAGDVKKSKVYVRGPKGNVVKVNFGDPDMKIKKSNPARRKSFRARHNCDNPGPRWKARYWSCRAW